MKGEKRRGEDKGRQGKARQDKARQRVKQQDLLLALANIVLQQQLFASSPGEKTYCALTLICALMVTAEPLLPSWSRKEHPQLTFSTTEKVRQTWRKGHYLSLPQVNTAIKYYSPYLCSSFSLNKSVLS